MRARLDATTPPLGVIEATAAGGALLVAGVTGLIDRTRSIGRTMSALAPAAAMDGMQEILWVMPSAPRSKGRV
ncbi:MAG: hypothetical protein ACK4IU_17805 [Tabrizicola flagellatus]|uniref:hypothetical protein n=1 Tax=Tabrizicola flagellatus TaxID=2593021 RepID=UPI00391B64C9